MRKISRITWALILVCAFLLAVNITLGYFLTKESNTALRTQIESRMLDVSNTAAAMLDGDILESLTAEDAETLDYQAALKTLSCFKANIGLAYIYLIRPLPDGSFIFMIDPDPETPGQFGEKIAYTDALHQASLGESAVDQEPYTDQWGSFYSAYSPVFDASGRVAGIVAVDFSADWYERQISNQIWTTLKIGGISIFFAAVIVTLLIFRYKRRVRFLMEEMNLVSDGIETLVQEISPGATLRLEAETQSADESKALGARIHSLQQQLGEQITMVRAMAYVDGLTGLANRAAYDEYVNQLNGEIRYRKASFAIGIFDLNGLKETNDMDGHERGDQMIRQAADLLGRVFPDAKRYRIGGDEFIVIREGLEPEIASRRALICDGPVSISQGYAVFDPASDMDFHMVFNRAEAEMYYDKRDYYRTHQDRRRHT